MISQFSIVKIQNQLYFQLIFLIVKNSYISISFVCLLLGNTKYSNISIKFQHFQNKNIKISYISIWIVDLQLKITENSYISNRFSHIELKNSKINYISNWFVYCQVSTFSIENSKIGNISIWFVDREIPKTAIFLLYFNIFNWKIPKAAIFPFDI